MNIINEKTKYFLDEKGTLTEITTPRYYSNHTTTQNIVKPVWEDNQKISFDKPRRRSPVEIQKVEEELYDKVWYARHMKSKKL